MERDLSIRLNLVANFATVAKEAAESLRSIATGIEDLKGLSIPLGTITGQMGDLNRATGLAKNSMGKLAETVGKITGLAGVSKESVDRMVSSITGLEGVSAKADVSVGSLGKKVRDTAAASAAAVTPTKDLGVAITQVGAATASTVEELAVMVGAVRELEREISSMRPTSLIRLSSSDMAALGEINAITEAIERLNMSLAVPRHLSLVVQQAAPLVARPGFAMVPPPPASYFLGGPRQPALATGQLERYMLSDGVDYGHGEGTRVLGPSAAWGAGAVPGATPWSPLERDMTTVGSFAPPPQIALPPGREGSAYWGQNPGRDTSGFNWRVWEANRRARMGNDLGGGGPAMPGFGSVNAAWTRQNIPNLGNDLSDFGREGLRAGNTMQSAGTGSLINAVMIGGLMLPVVKSITDIKDLFARTYEALKSGGATDENARKFAQGVADMSKQFGGDYRQNVGAVYNFASAIPPTAKIDYNNQDDQKKLQDAFGKIIKLQIAGSSSTHPMSMEETTLNVLATAENLGLHMRNATELGKAVEYVTNATIQMKNKTSTEADLFANSVKAIGPISANMGIDPEQIIGLVAAQAAGKIRGAPAGQNIKRLFSRQSLPPKELQELMAAVKQSGGDISMYNEKGDVRNLFEWIDSIGKFEKEKNLPAQVRAKLQGLLTGLYAAPGGGELIRFIQDIGGSAGMKKYTDDLLNKPLAGTKPGDSPLEGAFQARTTGNLLNRGTKTENRFLDEAGKDFDLLEPKMEKFLDGVDGLIDAWGRLSPSVKENVISWTAAFAAGSAVLGITGMLAGNFIKLGSAITLGIGATIKLFDHLSGFKALEGTWGRILAPLEGMGPAIITAVKDFALFDAAIEALPLLILGFAVAWEHNWFDVQGKTKAAISAIGNEMNKLPGQVGFIVGESEIKWLKFADGAKAAADKVIASFSTEMNKGLPTLAADGADAIGAWIMGLQNGFSDKIDAFGNTVVDWFQKFPQRFQDMKQVGVLREQGVIDNGTADVAGPGMPVDYGKSGNAGGEMFAKAMATHLGTTGKTAVSKGLQGIGDLFPHSEPKDSSSPLHGLGNSGRSAADMWIIGAIMGIGAGHAKIKKALKGPSDAFITLKNESVAQIKELAEKIEAEFAAVGVKTRHGMIDLLDPRTNKVTRVQGSPEAYKAAAAEFHGVHDTSAQQAMDYLNSIKRQIEAGLHVNVDKALLHLQHLAASALSAHATSEINGMIATMKAAWEKFPNEMGKQFATGKKAFENELLTVSSSGDRFDTLKQEQDSKIQKASGAMKDSSAPTSKELTSLISAEAFAHDKLSMSILSEIEAEKRLAAIKADLEAKIKSLSGSDIAQQHERDNLKSQLAELNVEYSAADDRIIKQKTDIDDLTKSIQTQSDALKHAKDSWQGIGFDVMSKAADRMESVPIKAIADHIQNYFQLQNTPKGSAGNSWIRQQSNNFTNSTIQDVFQDLFSTSGTSQLRSVMNKANKKTGTPASTTYEEKASSSLDKIDQNTKAFHVDPQTAGFQNESKGLLQDINLKLTTIATNTGPKSVGSGEFGAGFQGNLALKSTSSGSPVPVWISSQSGGSTDLGQKMSDSLTGASASGIVSALPASFAQMAKGMPKGESSSTSKDVKGLQQDAALAGEAMSLYEGLRTGGVSGGLQAGMSAFQMTGNPYIAGAAAIAGFIGVGPHETPQQTPDQSDPTYQQLLPNWAGTQQLVNGQVMQPNAQYSTYAGAQNQASQMYGFVSSPGSLIGANPTQVAAINQMNSLAGGMGAAGLAIKSEHQGVLTLASGQTISVTDFEQLLSTDQGMLTQFQNNTLQQQQNADRLASSFTSMTLMGPAGFVMPDLAGGGSRMGAGPSLMPRAGAGAAPGFRASNGSVAVSVSILQGATVASGADVQRAIESAIPVLTNAVQQGQYAQTRLMGDYSSETF